MSLELTSAEATAFDSLWKMWEAAPDNELEATLRFPNGDPLNYTSFLNIVKYLRSLGLQETVQAPKLNIMVAGGLRFTLVGEGVVSAYCRDNTLRGKPFHVVKKDKKITTTGISETDLKEYGVRIKLRRELPLSMDDPYVIDALSRWSSLPKSFRYIQRFSFTSGQHKGIQFDLSFVRENVKDRRGQYVQSSTFTGANISKQPIHYEAEVEVIRGSAKQKSLLVGIVTLLRGLQRSYVLVRESVKQSVLELLSSQTGSRRFPGSQPVTLGKENISMDTESSIPNIRYGDYNVTDKADGLRCLLVIAKDGRAYMVDRNLDVYGTDRRLDEAMTPEWAGAVLDGEWVTHNAEDKPMSRYYAFDIYNGKRGEDVTERPFLVREQVATSRLASLTAAVAALDGSTKTASSIPAHHSMSFHIKTFEYPADPSDPTAIFKKAGDVLDRLKTDAPYHTDGLIFTPNSMGLPRRGGKWIHQFKWKPASQNSVDFLVITEKERGVDGKPTQTELVNTALNEDTQQIVRYKTLRLYVGSSIDPALEDPRNTVLMKKPYPIAKDRGAGEYHPIVFRPQPPDPFASYSYVALNAGATDAAGAAPKSGAIASLDDTMYTLEGDPISNKSIVEMVYDPKKPAGWRWIPLRVRWDKTDQFQRREVGGTLNSEDVALDVWNSIHDPVTEYMIRTGAITEETIEYVGAAAGATAYYQRRASQTDLYKIRGLAKFHNQYIKETLLLSKAITPGAKLLDMSVGQAGDIHKWFGARVGFVLGCDIAETGLTDRKNGAYGRYLNYIIERKGAVPPMVFVQADSTLHYKDGAAGMSPMDRAILRTLWGESDPSAPPMIQDLTGAAAGGFDVAAMMFALHYVFKDRASIDGFLRNLSESVRVGGYFVGCGFDGATVAGLLRDLPIGGVKHGAEDRSDLWTITKQYDDSGSGVLPATEDGLGRAIDVRFISIGNAYTEYLVSWEYLVQRMGEIGFDLLYETELAALGLQHSTNMFKDSHSMAFSQGLNFPMSPALSTFSFLNRWYIFKRRSTGASVPLTAPGVDAAATLEERAELAGPMTATLVAPAPQPAAAPAEDAAVVGETLEEVLPEELAEVMEEAPEGAAPESAEGPALALADGPAYAFYHKSAAKDDLKLKDKHWRRYLSTYAPYKYRDPANPSILYTSLEAAMGAAKYQHATNKPELGAQIFSSVGNIAQETERKKYELGGAAGGAGAVAKSIPEDELAKLIEAEGNAMREESKPASIRKKGAKFDAAAWDGVKERVLVEYVRQRFEGDLHYREILNAVAAQKAKLVYYTAGTTTDMSGSIKDDGRIEGENLYGRALMRAVGLRY